MHNNLLGIWKLETYAWLRNKALNHGDAETSFGNTNL